MINSQDATTAIATTELKPFKYRVKKTEKKGEVRFEARNGKIWVCLADIAGLFWSAGHPSIRARIWSREKDVIFYLNELAESLGYFPLLGQDCWATDEVAMVFTRYCVKQKPHCLICYFWIDEHLDSLSAAPRHPSLFCLRDALGDDAEHIFKSFDYHSSSSSYCLDAFNYKHFPRWSGVYVVAFHHHVLYVGKSDNNVRNRWCGHKLKKKLSLIALTSGLRDKFHFYFVRKEFCRYSCRITESILIEVLNPLLNKQRF